MDSISIGVKMKFCVTPTGVTKMVTKFMDRIIGFQD